MNKLILLMVIGCVFFEVRNEFFKYCKVLVRLQSVNAKNNRRIQFMSTREEYGLALDVRNLTVRNLKCGT
jgi:hypothetical protein